MTPAAFCRSCGKALTEEEKAVADTIYVYEPTAYYLPTRYVSTEYYVPTSYVLPTSAYVVPTTYVEAVEWAREQAAAVA